MILDSFTLTAVGNHNFPAFMCVLYVVREFTATDSVTDMLNVALISVSPFNFVLIVNCVQTNSW